MYSLVLAVLYPSPGLFQPHEASQIPLSRNFREKQVIHSTELTRNCWDTERQDKAPSPGQNIPWACFCCLQQHQPQLQLVHHTHLAEGMEKARWKGWRQLWYLSSPKLPSEKQKTAPSPGAAARQEGFRSTYPPADIGRHPEELHRSYGADPHPLVCWPSAVQGHFLIKLGAEERNVSLNKAESSILEKPSGVRAESLPLGYKGAVGGRNLL